MTADPKPPTRAAFTFIFITVCLDMLALGIIVPVLPRLITAFEGGNYANAARMVGLFGFGSSAPAKQVILPASDPLVLGVGGTSLTANPVTGAYVSETAYNTLPGLPPPAGTGAFPLPVRRTWRPTSGARRAFLRER